MTLTNETEIKRQTLIEIARKMMVAARTAPKARGADNLEIVMLTGNHIKTLAEKMEEIGIKEDNHIFLRDSKNVHDSADVVILIGTYLKSVGLKLCGFCGFDNCEQKDKHPDIPCAYNTGDLGIAIGSAVSMAADYRGDNRIMYTIGYAAREMKILNSDVKIIYGIPLSATSKNPFFDRK